MSFLACESHMQICISAGRWVVYLVFICMYMNMCLFLPTRIHTKRERERDRETERQRDRETERERDSHIACMYKCMFFLNPCLPACPCNDCLFGVSSRDTIQKQEARTLKATHDFPNPPASPPPHRSPTKFPESRFSIW